MKRQGKPGRRRYLRRRLHRLLDGLLSIAVLLGASAVLMAALAPWEEAAPPEPVRPDSLTIYARNPAPAEPTAPAEPEPPREPVSRDSWSLILVNRWNPLPEDYSLQTVELQNGLQVDERCLCDLQAMLDACQAEGLSPVVCSAYRSRERQEELFSSRVDRLMAQGYSREDAEEETGRLTALPGTSEHQTGLAVDIVDLNNQLLDESQEDTAVQRWLMAHSWEYGFILRYPSGKSEITGILYEPWHYRYVGRADAERIHTLNICLEEYLSGTF